MASTRKLPRKFIFVVGGVMSGVGKGVAVSSIGKILQARGLAVTAMKIDPYINVDAGTMNPTEHGEVFVLADGYETDQDMGNYERFLGLELTRENYMTTGLVYKTVIEKERNLEYGGKCVQVVPHIPLEVISRIRRASDHAKADVTIVEIGGTVGEYENILFLEAVRMLKIKEPENVLTVIVSYVPTPSKIGEMKTKPTQHAVRTLNSAGIQPDIIIARASRPLDDKRKEKIATFCSVRPEDVISAPDVESIYDVPINFEKDHLSSIILKKLNVSPRGNMLASWKRKVAAVHQIRGKVKIGIVGKYFRTGDYILEDAYISVLESLKHAAYHIGVRPELVWLDAAEFEKEKSKVLELSVFDGILIPGGFGTRGVEGKIMVVEYCRTNKIPYFGLCYGMQLAVIEYARHVARLTEAHTTEVNPKTPHPVIDILPDQRENVERHRYGATMRLGQYPTLLQPGTMIYELYGVKRVFERHRHRYEVNPKYIGKLEKAGLVFSAISPDKVLMEAIELSKQDHPFFIGTQYHPEFQSSLHNPHPLFVGFLRACAKRKKEKNRSL